MDDDEDYIEESIPRGHAVEIFIDKSKWVDGPWKNEPDRKEWKHLGFPCLIVRVENHGALCGYVAVPPGHPWHGKHYGEIEASVHGGLTYADRCDGHVCHVPAPGEPEDVWWLGFDHAHGGDMCPGRERINAYYSAFPLGDPDGSFEAYGRYRDMAYVIKGVEDLAAQAQEAGAM